MKINLVDTNKGKAGYFNNHWPIKEVEYVGPFLEWEGITVFTDEMCFHPVVDQIKSKYKIAWSIESPVIKPYFFNYIKQVENKFDYIYTYNPEPNNLKYKQSYFGACWIVEENCKIYEKTKLLSIVASNKNYAPGHKLRHEIISKNLHKDLELWGSGYNWFSDAPEDRVKPFKDYMYVIVIENCKYPNYFTDKIIDCFAAGCIPIYWGDPKIKEIFDERGFYTFNTMNELDYILSNRISADDYNLKTKYIQENHRRMFEYASPDKWMYNNCYKKLQEKGSL
jgi:hypothetical protein